MTDPNTPQSDIELAEALGTDRKSLRRWREKPGNAPQTRDVGQWVEFMRKHLLGPYSPQRGYGGLPRPGAEDPDEEEDDAPGAESMSPPRYRGSIEDWKRAQIAKVVEKDSIGIHTLKGTLLEACEMEVLIGSMLSAIATKLHQFPFTAAKSMIGHRDAGDAENALRYEMEAVILDIHNSAYTTERAVADAVASLPFDAETESLLTLILFEGQDRAAFLQLVTSVATQALRQIGRRVIETGQRSQESPELEPTTPTESIGERIAPSVESRGAQQESATSGKKSRKRSRPQPTPPPGEVEGAMVEG